jgi:TldD protein
MTSLNSAAASVRQTNVSGRPPARPTRESTSGRLVIAQKLLLEPFGLNAAALSRALGEITSHGVDDADLYFQYTRSEGWSLEEGIVKTGSFSIDQGVGVRAVSAEKTAFA